MPQGHKSNDTDKQKRQAEARAWASFNKPHGGGNKIASGRKVPNGPVGGSGRKTNLSRSS